MWTPQAPINKTAQIKFDQIKFDQIWNKGPTR